MVPIRCGHRRAHRHAVHLPRTCQPGGHLLVPVRLTGADGTRRPAAARPVRSSAMSALAPALQAYFTERLVSQRAASPNTIAAYKVTFRLLLGFVSQRTGKAPSTLDIAELDAPLIAAFLDHLEHDRHNSVATRNNR